MCHSPLPMPGSPPTSHHPPLSTLFPPHEPLPPSSSHSGCLHLEQGRKYSPLAGVAGGRKRRSKPPRLGPATPGRERRTSAQKAPQSLSPALPATPRQALGCPGTPSHRLHLHTQRVEAPGQMSQNSTQRTPSSLGTVMIRPVCQRGSAPMGPTLPWVPVWPPACGSHPRPSPQPREPTPSTNSLAASSEPNSVLLASSPWRTLTNSNTHFSLH